MSVGEAVEPVPVLKRGVSARHGGDFAAEAVRVTELQFCDDHGLPGNAGHHVLHDGRVAVCGCAALGSGDRDVPVVARVRGVVVVDMRIDQIQFCAEGLEIECRVVVQIGTL